MFFVLLILFFSSFSISQTRYLDEFFNDYVKTEDVIYGNAPDLPFIFLFEWNTVDIDLEMDIYEPLGDINQKRPVVMFIHPGSFFSGSNESDDMVELSIAAAKRGYVAVSISYRLGLNVLSSYSGERAVYRGVQDASAAIRYLREFHEDLRIDPNNIFIWGSSAGSFVGLHLNYYEDSDRPESTFGDSSIPDLGCIDCAGNNYNHSSKPNGLISCWGAIADLNAIDASDDSPILMFHGNLDPIVPFDSGFPFTIDIALPFVYGSNSINSRLDELGIENQFFIGQGQLHEYWGTVNGNWFLSEPNDFYYDIIDKSFLFLYNNLKFYVTGDLNLDQQINVSDLVIMVNHIVESSIIDDEIFELADINNDLTINVRDIILLVNIILE